MITKISLLRAAATAGDWQTAIRIAARFPRLGAIRGEVLDAHLAFTNPRFAQQIGKDPNRLISAGITAITQTYLSRPLQNHATTGDDMPGR